MLTAVLALACSPVLGDLKVPTAKRDDLGEFAVKAGAVTFNNFCVGEGTNHGATVGPREHRGFNVVTVRGTFRNPSAERLAYTLVVYGVSEGGEVEWTCQLAGIADREDVGILDGHIPVLPGTLNKTPTIRVRATVGPVPATEPQLSPAPALR